MREQLTNKPANMKYAPLVCLSLLYSCQLTTESKLANAVKQNVREGFRLNKEKEESLEVSSLTYELSDSSIYYSHLLHIETEYFSQLTGIMKSALQMPMDSNTTKLIRDEKEAENKSDFVARLMENARRGNYVYKVKYRLQYKTDQEGIDKIDSMYLHFPDLSEVYLNLDSAYRSTKISF
jgi:hypothetical protein